MAAATVRWESMKLFDPAAFARFDLTIDDIYPSNLSSSEKRKLRDLTLARSKNNALLAIRWRPTNPTPAQARARNHNIEHIRYMSDFKLDKIIVRSNRRVTGLSRLENLPLFLLCKISLLLENDVDDICLSLTSKVMAASMRQFWARSHRCPVCGEYHDNDFDGEEYSWYELAMRLKDSMPNSLQFCYHCLIFLPRHSFATDDASAEIDHLVCFDCLRLTNPQFRYDADDCGGCEIWQCLLDGEDDAEKQDERDANSLSYSSEISAAEDDDSQRPGLPNAGAACVCM